MAEPAGTKLYLMAPLEIEVGEKYETLWDEIRAQRLRRGCASTARRTRSISRRQIDRRRKHLVEVVDRPHHRSARCAASRIADSVENALVAGQRRAARRLSDRRRAGAEVATRDSQPAFRLRQVRPQLRAAHAAQLFVQQLAGLVPGVRRLGHANRRESGGAAARSETDAGRRARSALWPGVEQRRCSSAMLAALSAHTGVPLDVPFEQLSAKQRRIVLARHRRGLDRRVRRRQAQEDRAAAVPLSIQGSVSGAGRSGAALAGAARQAGASGRRSRMLDLRRQPAARRRRGRAVARSHDRRTLPHAAGRIARANSTTGSSTAAERKIAGELLREVQQSVAVSGRRRAWNI